MLGGGGGGGRPNLNGIITRSAKKEISQEARKEGRDKCALPGPRFSWAVFLFPLNSPPAACSPLKGASGFVVGE